MPTFTKDWFSNRIAAWEAHIKPALEGRPCKWLELGSYEGRSALWTVENILIHPDSTIDCVDRFDGAYAQKFDTNTAGCTNLTKHVSDTELFLQKAADEGKRYDCIYIDADHKAESIFSDAVRSWAVLNSGGFIIFDDYLIEKGAGEEFSAQNAIDFFVSCWKQSLRVIYSGYQIIIQKL